MYRLPLHSLTMASIKFCDGLMVLDICLRAVQHTRKQINTLFETKGDKKRKCFDSI